MSTLYSSCTSAEPENPYKDNLSMISSLSSTSSINLSSVPSFRRRR